MDAREKDTRSEDRTVRANPKATRGARRNRNREEPVTRKLFRSTISGAHTHTHALLLLSTSQYYQFPATTTGGPPKQTAVSGSHPETRRFARKGQSSGARPPKWTMQRNPPPFREESRQLATPPGAHPGVPARQAHPTRRPHGTQHPHGCQLPLYNLGKTLSIQGSLRKRPEGGNTHTHTPTHPHTHTPTHPHTHTCAIDHNQEVTKGSTAFYTQQKCDLQSAATRLGHHSAVHQPNPSTNRVPRQRAIQRKPVKRSIERTTKEHGVPGHHKDCSEPVLWKRPTVRFCHRPATGTSACQHCGYDPNSYQKSHVHPKSFPTKKNLSTLRPGATRITPIANAVPTAGMVTTGTTSPANRTGDIIATSVAR